MAPTPHSETCIDFARRWPEDFPRDAPDTNRQHRYVVGNFCLEFGERALTSISYQEAREWALKNPGKGRYLRTMFNDAMAVGAVQSNPFANLRLSQGRGRRDITVLEIEEVERLIDNAPAPMNAMIRFSAYTGIRLGEHLGLYRTDVSGPRARIIRQRRRDGSFADPKNDSKRTILVPRQARAGALARQTGPLWDYSRSEHWRQWDAVRRAAGIDIDWHELRHFCATWFLELGASPEDVAVQLGHCDGGQLVRDLYGHPDPELALVRLERLAA